MNTYIKIIIASIALAFVSCESMEDTYSKWTEGGESYHVGKISNLEIETGWKRLRMNWVNSHDPSVTNIKIRWSAGEKSDSVIIDGKATSFETDQVLDNATYNIEVYAINKEGKLSLRTSQYAKPFTEEHEAVLSFTKIERKSFYIQNHLILFWNSLLDKGFTNKALSYYSNGVLVELVLTDDIINQKYMSISNVDEDQPILISRSAYIEDCYDEIAFEAYEIEKDHLNLNGDFAKQIKESHNLENDLTPQFIGQLTEINIDYSLSSLEDILYFPNLRKLSLGSTRYFDPSYLTGDLSILSDLGSSIYAINIAHDLLGIEVDIYNDHFNILSHIVFATDKGNPILPSLPFLNSSAWTIKVDTEEVEPGENGYSNPEYLLDNDKTTVWEPLSVKNDVRKHELIIDMEEVKEISGFQISTPLDEKYKQYFPESIHVMYSTDQVVWKQAFNYINVTLGKNNGESRVLYFPEKYQARYVRIYVKDIFDSSRSNVNLADFLLF